MFSFAKRHPLKRKPRLDAPTPEARIAALAALGDDAQDDLERMFLGDADRAVRLAALARLTRAAPIVQALADATVAAEALERLRALPAGTVPPPLREHPAILRAEVASAGTAESALEAASRIQDVGERADAILSHPAAGVRLEVVDGIWDVATLAALAKRARGADNAAHRLVRERSTLHNNAQAVRDGEDGRTEGLLAAATAIADDDVHYDARRHALERKWEDHLAAIAATDATLARFGVAKRDSEVLRQRFPTRRPTPKEQHADPEAWGVLVARAEALRARVEAAMAAIEDMAAAGDCARATKADLDELLADWGVLADTEPPDETPSGRFHDVVSTVATRVQDIERAGALADAAAAALAARLPTTQFGPFDARQRELDRQRAEVQRLIARHGWPEAVAEPAQLTALRQREQALGEAAAGCVAEAETLAAEVARQLRELREKAESGAGRQAIEHHEKLREMVSRLPKENARVFSAELAQLGAAARELREWRQYAEAPRREALCEEMEALAEQPRSPAEQTVAVRDLRQRWNELGPADMRGGRALRKRFDTAAELAFAPCRAHFKAHAERRAFNLEQRRAIVGALEDFLENNDWKKADWRGVEQVLRQARAEWSKYHPVERKAERPLKERFEELASRVHALLKEAWQRNIEAKESLVAEANKVRESGEQASAKAAAMKALQRRWKQAGPVPRSVDQRLWKRFRAECDAVFTASTEAMGRHRERRAAIDEAESLLGELERRVDLDASLDRNAVADYERRVDALGSLPKELLRRAETVIRDADRAVVEQERGQ